MRVRIFISNGTTWEATWEAECRDGADRDCLALPKDACRFEFWRKETGLPLYGHAMVWEVMS